MSVPVLLAPQGGFTMSGFVGICGDCALYAYGKIMRTSVYAAGFFTTSTIGGTCLVRSWRGAPVIDIDFTGAPDCYPIDWLAFASVEGKATRSDWPTGSPIGTRTVKYTCDSVTGVVTPNDSDSTWYAALFNSPSQMMPENFNPGGMFDVKLSNCITLGAYGRFISLLGSKSLTNDVKWGDLLTAVDAGTGPTYQTHAGSGNVPLGSWPTGWQWAGYPGNTGTFMGEKWAIAIPVRYRVRGVIFKKRFGAIGYNTLYPLCPKIGQLGLEACNLDPINTDIPDNVARHQFGIQDSRYEVVQRWNCDSDFGWQGQEIINGELCNVFYNDNLRQISVDQWGMSTGNYIVSCYDCST